MSYRRKKRNLQPKPVQQDPDDLFKLLLEQAVTSTPHEWFQAPWKDGRNAIILGIILCTDVIKILDIDYAEHDEEDLFWQVGKFCLTGFDRMDHIEAYWTAQEYRTKITVLPKSEYLLSVLNMIQRWSSHSDGGGILYNNHLITICESYLSSGGILDKIEPLVRRARGRDLVGLSPDINEPMDQAVQKRLRGFDAVWQKGLYKIAFTF